MFEDLLTDGNSYKNLICIIHYIVPRVVKRNFEDEDGNIIKNKYGYFKSSIESNIHKLKKTIENLWDFDDEFYDEKNLSNNIGIIFTLWYNFIKVIIKE